MRRMGIAGGIAAAVLLGSGAGGALFAEGLRVSGVLDNSLTVGAGAGELPDCFAGAEACANIRVQGTLRDGVSFYSAVNLLAASGTSALGLTGIEHQGVAAAARNYAAALELERLSFRLSGSFLDFDGGLLRIPFGYGQVFGPSDFLNPRNPLMPDARVRAVLGGSLSAYPADSRKVQVFGAAPRNPSSLDGGGTLAGISGERHGDRASFQAVYAYETPREGSPWGVHRGGFSFKAEAEAGLVADVLYTCDPEAGFGIQGLAASAGGDYSFWEGKWYVLAEYLYNGRSSSTSVQSGNSAGFSGEHFLYAVVRYLVNDYTSLSLACLSGLSDCSFAPILGAEHELFQGFTVSMSARVPLDRDNRGELGPENSRVRFIFNLKARLRF
ncbi:MAG: hypothetical protein LBE17_14850 [Treponema sp.]|jgi:hypothetical protein|nr:hypothetical protein [Treponema sp.]